MSKCAELAWFPVFLAMRVTGFVIVETLTWLEELTADEG